MDPLCHSSGSYRFPAIGQDAYAAPAPQFQPMLALGQQLQGQQAFAANGLLGAQALGQGWNGLVAGANQQRPPVVAVIDDFVAGQGGYNHGQEIAGIIERDGVATQRFNINDGNSREQNILRALDQVLAQAQAGQRVDAVNLSQASFQNSPLTAAIQQRIQALEGAGIPVVVAAGGNGANQANQLGRGASFVVENSGFGSEFRANDSGLGNIRAEGRFTSQATASVAAKVARLRHQGLSTGQTAAQLQGLAQQQGGSLNS